MIRVLIKDNFNFNKELILDAENNDITFLLNDQTEQDVFFHIGDDINKKYLTIKIYDFFGNLNLELVTSELLECLNISDNVIVLELYQDENLKKSKKIANCKYILSIDNQFSNDENRLQEVLYLKVEN